MLCREHLRISRFPKKGETLGARSQGHSGRYVCLEAHVVAWSWVAGEDTGVMVPGGKGHHARCLFFMSWRLGVEAPTRQWQLPGFRPAPQGRLEDES